MRNPFRVWAWEEQKLARERISFMLGHSLFSRFVRFFDFRDSLGSSQISAV